LALFAPDVLTRFAYANESLPVAHVAREAATRFIAPPSAEVRGEVTRAAEKQDGDDGKGTTKMTHADSWRTRRYATCG
jgi:hypothetical protein